MNQARSQIVAALATSLCLPYRNTCRSGSSTHEFFLGSFAQLSIVGFGSDGGNWLCETYQSAPARFEHHFISVANIANTLPSSIYDDLGFKFLHKPKVIVPCETPLVLVVGFRDRQGNRLAVDYLRSCHERFDQFSAFTYFVSH